MKDTLNPNEWIVMEALWAKSPATLGETIDRIGSRASWNYKTYQSYMNVLEKKGYISSEKRGRDKFYSPAISREECIARESRAVLSKMQSDSVGLMITSMVREGDLSRSDRLELMNMLEKMLKEETENESDRSWIGVNGNFRHFSHDFNISLAKIILFELTLIRHFAKWQMTFCLIIHLTYLYQSIAVVCQTTVPGKTSPDRCRQFCTPSDSFPSDAFKSFQSHTSQTIVSA